MGEPSADQEREAAVSERVGEQIEGVGDRRRRRIREAVEPHGPHEVAGGPAQERECHQEPRRAIRAPADGAQQAERCRSELDARIETVVDEAVDRAATDREEGVRGLEQDREREDREGQREEA